MIKYLRNMTVLRARKHSGWAFGIALNDASQGKVLIVNILRKTWMFYLSKTKEQEIDRGLH